MTYYGIWDNDDKDWVKSYRYGPILAFDIIKEAEQYAADYFGYNSTDYQRAKNDDWCEVRELK